MTTIPVRCREREQREACEACEDSCFGAHQQRKGRKGLPENPPSLRGCLLSDGKIHLAEAPSEWRLLLRSSFNSLALALAPATLPVS
jgi:hypothetical protein